MTELTDPKLQLPIAYRIRIGVTGHRKLHDPDRFRTLVARVLDTEIKQLFNEASVKAIAKAKDVPIRLSVVSPIAEGADRLVASEVLKRREATLQVALPLALDDYLETFQGEASKVEFLDLLAKCREPHFLRRPTLAQDFAAINIAAARLHAY